MLLVIKVQYLKLIKVLLHAQSLIKYTSTASCMNEKYFHFFTSILIIVNRLMLSSNAFLNKFKFKLTLFSFQNKSQSKNIVLRKQSLFGCVLRVNNNIMS